jgi:hypothetical protein
MSYEPADFALHHYKNFKVRADVTAALLERPNCGFTVEELNEKLGREPSRTAIEGIRRVLRELGELGLIAIETRGNLRGPPTKIYKPGKMLDSYRDPILSSVFGEGRVEVLDSAICCAIRCHKSPMQCPDQNCRVCAANAIETCWNLDKE